MLHGAQDRLRRSRFVKTGTEASQDTSSISKIIEQGHQLTDAHLRIT